MSNQTLCKCCGEQEIERAAYEICTRCGWQDDPVQKKDPKFEGGANQMSLNEARAYWQATHRRVECANGSAEMNAIQREARGLLGVDQ
jgi:xanthine dehydrogenase iron-sulfur cluster and FAD-binding subunit A